MAKATFTTKTPGSLKSVTLSDYSISTIINEEVNSKITDKTFKLNRLSDLSYSTVSIDDGSRLVRINDILPFRIKFTTIGIEGYGPNNIPPIGIAIIGYNNYIL